MDILKEELSRIVNAPNDHQWALKPSNSRCDLSYYFADRDDVSSTGETALHRLVALHTPASVLVDWLCHAERHCASLLVEEQHNQKGCYQGLPPPLPLEQQRNHAGLTVLHVAVYRNSWSVAALVEVLLGRAPSLAAMRDYYTFSTPLHVCTGQNVTICDEVFLQLLQAYPRAATLRDINGDTPMSLLWKNVLRFRWARNWDVLGEIPDYTLGDPSWMTVISPAQFANYCLHMIAATAGKGDDLEGLTWFDVCASPHCPPLLIRMLLTRNQKMFHNSSLGSLADVDDHGRLPLHWVAASDPVSHAFIPPVVASRLTTAVSLVLRAYPPAAAAVDDFGRLPLHYYLTRRPHAKQTTIDPSTVLALVRAHPASLATQDPVTGLFPVQQLATVVGSDHVETELTVIYRLLRACPSVVVQYRSQ